MLFYLHAQPLLSWKRITRESIRHRETHHLAKTGAQQETPVWVSRDQLSLQSRTLIIYRKCHSSTQQVLMQNLQEEVQWWQEIGRTCLQGAQRGSWSRDGELAIIRRKQWICAKEKNQNPFEKKSWESSREKRTVQDRTNLRRQQFSMIPLFLLSNIHFKKTFFFR